jgi:thiol-disulfide isomerase/thioredoxin
MDTSRTSETIDQDRHPLSTRRSMLATAAAAGAFGLARLAAPSYAQDVPATDYLRNATPWLNSRPLTTAELRGKVVVIDFWTYTCINWLRSLPYVRAWAEAYQNAGLVVIGVHTPEFAFERNIDNVRRAAKGMRVDYPIAIDNDYAIWRAFNNQYWPALYFIDAQGRIRHHKFGEGEYEQSEMVIQRLLTEAGIRGVGHELVSVDARGAEAAADWGDLKSPENYLGYERTENFGAARAQSMGAGRRLDRGETGDAAEPAQRADCVPLSRPGSSSRNGAGGARKFRAFPRADRWTAARRRSRP